MIQPWFEDAKLGIFLHWGIYAEGDGIAGSEDASWPIFNKQETVEGYMARRKNFTASKYDPAAWAEMIENAGAKYAVLTAKHCDGFALWDTAQQHWSAVKHSPAGRDLVGPFVSALRDRGLRAGLYFSHSDWTHPLYPTITRDVPHVPLESSGYRIVYPEPGHDDPALWRKYLAFHRAQLRELCERYKPDLLWFDADWERDMDQWQFPDMIAELDRIAPQAVLNDRNLKLGDYTTPEQGIPLKPPNGPWEMCSTLNDAWGYNPRRGEIKTEQQLIRQFLDVIAMGGNLLLNIGPKLDGSFDPAMAARVLELGTFCRDNAQAIYGTRAGIPATHFYGPSTLSKDHKTLYAFVLGDPRGQIAIKGVKTPVSRATLVGQSDEPLKFTIVGGAAWAGVPGVLWIDIPPCPPSVLARTVKIEFASTLELYTGEGLAVTQN